MSPPWEGRGLSHISAIWVCATVKGMVFRQLSSETGERIGCYLPEKWLVLIIKSRIGFFTRVHKWKIIEISPNPVESALSTSSPLVKSCFTEG